MFIECTRACRWGRGQKDSVHYFMFVGVIYLVFTMLGRKVDRRARGNLPLLEFGDRTVGRYVHKVYQGVCDFEVGWGIYLSTFRRNLLPPSFM